VQVVSHRGGAFFLFPFFWLCASLLYFRNFVGADARCNLYVFHLSKKECVVGGLHGRSSV
jgi:hypothetical protein